MSPMWCLLLAVLTHGPHGARGFRMEAGDVGKTALDLSELDEFYAAYRGQVVDHHQLEEREQGREQGQGELLGDEWMKKRQKRQKRLGSLQTSLPEAWRSRFQIENLLGAGGFGEVYQVRVTCGEGHHLVSAKMMKRDASWSSERLLEQMHKQKLEEQRMGAKWSPYIVSTVGVPSVEGDSWLENHTAIKSSRWVMMELLNGGSFEDLLKTCSRDTDCNCMNRSSHACWEAESMAKSPANSMLKVLALFHQAVEGVEAIHKQGGLVHMDIKPDNLMLHCVENRCQSKVIDLGALCNDKTCDVGRVVGTQNYLAPEIYSFEEGQVYIPANDVWALGVTLFELMYLGTPSFVVPFLTRYFIGSYKADEDKRIPKQRNDMDQLVVDMLEHDYKKRITLSAVKARVAKFIREQNPPREVLDMIEKSPSERGLVDEMPPCALKSYGGRRLASLALLAFLAFW